MDPLLAGALALLLGATLGPDWPVEPLTVAALGGAALASWHPQLRPGRRTLHLLLAAGLAAWVANRSAPPPSRPVTYVRTTGVVREVAWLADRTRIVLHAPDPPWPDDVVALLPPETNVEVGQVRELRGRFLPPEDRAMALGAAARGTRGTIVDATVQPAASPGEAGLLLRLRRAVAERLLALHPGDRGALAVGLLTGSRTALSAQAQDAMRASGLAHITAISGANFVLVVELLRRAASRLGRTAQPVALSAGTLLFWAFVDGGMAVARAALTTLVGLAASTAGRRARANRTLALSAALLTIFSPLAPRADASLQLSVLATVAVLLANRGSEVQGVLEWRTTLRTSIGTTLATLPVQLVAFGATPLVAPLANVLALPLVPLTMAASAAELVVADVPGVGLVARELAARSAGAILWVARATSALPFARVELPALPSWSHGLVLAGGGAIALWLALRPTARRAAEIADLPS